MSRLHVEATATIDASPSDVYATFADYRNGHPRILPKQYFSDLDIEQGGIGEGTVFRVRVQVMGIGQDYHLMVHEPEPGRLLTETDIPTGLVTSFIVNAIDGGKRAQVTIATDWNAKPGFLGVMERFTTPPVMRRIYAKELAQLGDYLRSRKGTLQREA